MLQALVNGSMAVALVLLLAGFLDRSPRSPLLRAAGWVLFAVYWPFQAQHFFDIGDPVNAWFTLLGPLVVLYFAWHEVRSWRWKEDPPALRWLAGTSFAAAGVYFLFLVFPALAGGLIRVTAIQTVWMLRLLFRLDAHVGEAPRGAGVEAHPTDWDILLATDAGLQEYAVTIILACTAIQSLMIFAGAILCVRAPLGRKWKAALLTLPAIHVLNLFRNAGIVYGYKILDWGPFGMDSFEWMHSYVGKFGSLAALVVLALVLFTVLPELHGNILDLFDLPKRKRPGFFERPPGGPPHEASAAPSTGKPVQGGGGG